MTGYYEPLLECRWLVIGQEDQVVTLNFTRLKLEPPGANDTEPCPYDRIEVSRGQAFFFDLQFGENMHLFTSGRWLTLITFLDEFQCLSNVNH